MKIEKINDRQIRCTLTREDLANRKIKLSELAYGSDKAKELFQDMMQVAAQDFGFEADNTPLVIEAVPVSMDSIILIITKVEDPEELDTRFSRFSPEDSDGSNGPSLFDLKDHIEGADDILGLIKRITEAKNRAAKELAAKEQSSKEQTAAPKDETNIPQADDMEEVRNLTCFYQFRSLDDAIHAAAVTASIYDGPNSLFKNAETGEYYLLLQKAENPARDFNRACNMLSEYAVPGKFFQGMSEYFSEHMELIVAEHALQDLAQLN